MYAEARQKRVVIEHLLEVRHLPRLVDRITSKAAAELIVDAATRHRAKRLVRDCQRELGARPRPVPQDGVERHRLREFGRATKAAVTRVMILSQPSIGPLEERR